MTLTPSLTALIQVARLDGFAATARHALLHLRVEGVETTAGFARDLLAHPDVAASQTHTRWIEEDFLPTWSGREAGG